MGTNARARRDVLRALCGRLRDVLPVRAGRTNDAIGVGRTPRDLRPATAPRQDARDSVRALCPTGCQMRRAEQTRDIRLPRLHAHRRERPSRSVCATSPNQPEEAEGEARRDPRGDKAAAA
jgi:hypothetical protein